jgi:Holliday junction resolvase RusA-like endonuclease
MLRRNGGPDGISVSSDGGRPVLPWLAPAELDAANLALEANAGALGADVTAPALVAQSIVLALPPSANVYWRYGPNGVHVSEEAQNYKAGVKWKALHQGMQPMSGELALYVNVYRQQKRGDLDNYAKVLGDALNGVAYHDDSQVVELHMWRHDDRKSPRVEVEIRMVAL